MSEIERYEGDVPSRVVVLQGKGHGPVYVRSPGLTAAFCLEPGCMWRGAPRGPLPTADTLIESDARAHLEMVAYDHAPSGLDEFA